MTKFMDISTIKNTREFFWTNHSKYKLLQYGFSPTAVKSVIRRPDRIETGIAPKTTAVMKRKDSKKMKKEVWVMYQTYKNTKLYLPRRQAGKTTKVQKLTNQLMFAKTRIISAWIYPGVSPKGKDIYVPEDVWKEL